MPARNRVPSFQIASGTANERDNSYNIPTGSIFFNTDTSNIELSGNVVASDISGVNNITFADGTEQTSAASAPDLANLVDATSVQTISGLKTFTSGVKFSDGTTMSTAIIDPACVGFMCEMTQDQTASSNAALYYNDTIFDTDSGVTQTTSGTVSTRYTIPKAGYWWFGITASGANSNIGPAVFRNNTKVLQAGQSMSGFYAVVTFGIVECAVGDIITPKNTAPLNTFRATEAPPYFQGYYIGSA